MDQHYKSPALESTKSEQDVRKETIGWLSMIAIMFMFPVLFYVCVFFPIWVGLTPRW